MLILMKVIGSNIQIGFNLFKILKVDLEVGDFSTIQ